MTYRAEIIVAAGKHGLDPDLVQALIEKESDYRVWAWNPEPKYRYLWNVRTNTPFRSLKDVEIGSAIPPPDFPTLAADRDQEFWGQKASWGLMQVMGAVARERGFRGAFLTELCDPIVNLEYGCRQLAHLIGWARQKFRGLSSAAEGPVRISALAAYNGGPSGNAPTTMPVRNKPYADTVLSIYERLRSANA